MRNLEPRSVHWLCATCEGCGRRVRASHALRFWGQRPTPTLDDAEIMVATSKGYASIANERSNLWASAMAMSDYGQRRQLGDVVATYFETMEARLLAASSVARRAAARARYGR